ncbi:hypothetical protein DLE01_29965, partial [Streptomyces sp. FT05W]
MTAHSRGEATDPPAEDHEAGEDAGGRGALFDVDEFTVTTSGAAPREGAVTGIGGKCVDVAGGATAD